MSAEQCRLRQLAVELTKSTQDGSIAWSDTEDEGAFQVEVRGAVFIIERVGQGQQEAPFLLTVLSRKCHLAGSHAPADALDQEHLRALWEAAAGRPCKTQRTRGR